MPDQTSEAFYGAAEQRIEYFTLAIGAGAALLGAWKWSWTHAAGIALGAVLAWINYRWMKQGIGAMAGLAAAQADAEKIRLPKGVYVKFFARYALLVGVIYVIFARSLLPAAAVVGGLFTLVAAVFLETMVQLLRGRGEVETR